MLPCFKRHRSSIEGIYRDLSIREESNIREIFERFGRSGEI
jgi:hypothetical protein